MRLPNLEWDLQNLRNDISRTKLRLASQNHPLPFCLYRCSSRSLARSHGFDLLKSFFSRTCVSILVLKPLTCSLEGKEGIHERWRLYDRRIARNISESDGELLFRI